MDKAVGQGPARIGPNTILRVHQAMEAGGNPAQIRQVFETAGIAVYLERPPSQMVDEREVTALHQALRDVLGLEQARAVGRDAGRLTGDYLLANRIPPFAQAILKVLPAPLAGRLLIKAIERNAWTFAGSSVFTYSAGRSFHLSLAGCRLCVGAVSEVPLCDYYSAAFERLFRELVAPQARVTEVQCQAQGYPACLFDVDFTKTT
jgi:divinyl protochlorophyllide a 8-vinyl-reductase